MSVLPTTDPPRRILMADDDDDDFDIFSLALSDVPVKAELSRVVDGEKLLEHLNVSIPDLLFLDIVMPCKNGKDCLCEIRRDPRFDRLPIIVYTSMDDLMNIEFCFKEKSNLYAIKPLRLVDLTAMLNKILTIDWDESSYFPKREDFILRAAG